MTSLTGMTGFGGLASLLGGRSNKPSATGSNVGQNMTGVTGGNKLPGGLKHGQIQQFTPEQIELFKSMFGQLGPDSFLGKLAGGDEEMFRQIEAPALRQFGQLQGNLASRFSGMGTGGRRSSGFQNTMSQAGQDFSQQLQSQRLGLQNQAIRDLMGMSNQLLGQRPYEQFVQKPFWQELLGGAAGGLTQAAAMLPFIL